MNQRAFRKTIAVYRERVCPAGAPPGDPAARIAELATTHPQLAADVILIRDSRYDINRTIDLATIELIRVFENLQEQDRIHACTALIELALNLTGRESDLAWFSPRRQSDAFGDISHTLTLWEQRERFLGVVEPAVEKAARNILNDWKRVLGGKSMTAKIAQNIEKEIQDEDNGPFGLKFIQKARQAITENVYYQMRENKMCKLGNDSATGLRFVRHLGFVQVSSNPVIAARALEEFPELWDTFKEVVRVNPEWQANPELYGNEITLHATITSLLPNILAFRPLALLSDFKDGLVSYQLNPLGAGDFTASVEDAEEICGVLREILLCYDAWLGWDPVLTKGRPNIVFKVAACASVARRITTGLNARGIGTNNTVTYGVSQELTLLMDAVRGMARAIKRGIPVSQIYETNMIGRLEDHLREQEARRFLSAFSDQDIDAFGEKLCQSVPQGTREEKVNLLSLKKNIKSFTDPAFRESLRAVFGNREEAEDYLGYLALREEDIEHAGIYVTRRVYQFFFSPDARPKWIRYFQKRYALSDAEIQEIMNKVDLLPASKRRAQDTYLVLGTPNVTNTEFPDQQLKVFEASRSNEFDLARFSGSIREEPDAMRLERLLGQQEFQEVYELTPALKKMLREVGVEDNYTGGTRGMKPAEWPAYGAVQKTMEEFQNAYRDFRNRAITVVREVSQ